MPDDFKGIIDVTVNGLIVTVTVRTDDGGVRSKWFAIPSPLETYADRIEQLTNECLRDLEARPWPVVPWPPEVVAS